MSAVDLVKLVGEVTALVGPEATEAGVKISFEPSVPMAIVDADQDLLKHAVLNIVMNGIEAMEDGGKLDISISRTREEYELKIADNGPGIPPEVREKVFNLYFTTKEGGSGIGLAMTFRVVHLHDATIEFSSAMGKGTVFRLRFAVSEETAASQDERPAPSEDSVVAGES
jgi:signal transduction histidine kinase